MRDDEDDEIAEPVVDDYRPSRHIINSSEEEYVTENDDPLCELVSSGRSSISSIPASIIHHDVVSMHDYSHHEPATPSRPRTGTSSAYIQDYKHMSALSIRDHISGFRNPSSIRALQMRDECSDNEESTPGHRRRGSRMSHVSYRSGSAHSTPGKRLSRSLQGSPTKGISKLRREFPLVLLHCTLLPSVISPKVKLVNEELLEAIIPEPYKKRWKMLQDKVAKNFEVRERGVLIPHPKDDYDALEERLLESLELERSVLNNGHFVGRSDSRASVADSGFGSEVSSTRGDVKSEDLDDTRCADCGGYLCGEKRWEVKVYAANGLLKAGAWGAAWNEMEKVDVQVSVWLPDEVRREVESRLDAVIAQERQLQDQEHELRGQVDDDNDNDDERTREIYGAGVKPQRPTQSEETMELSLVKSSPPDSDLRSAQDHALVRSDRSYAQHEASPNTTATVRGHTQPFLQDQRNMVIVLLSILLVFFGVQNTRSSMEGEMTDKSPLRAAPSVSIERLTTTIISTSTSIAVETSTIVETTQLVASASAVVSSPVWSEDDAVTSKTSTRDSTGDVIHSVQPVTSSSSVPEPGQSLMGKNDGVFGSGESDTNAADASLVETTIAASTPDQDEYCIFERDTTTTRFWETWEAGNMCEV